MTGIEATSVARMLAQAYFGMTVTLREDAHGGCRNGQSRDGITHPCEARLWGGRPNGSKERDAYRSAAFVANVNPDGTVTCGRDGCGQSFRYGGELAHIAARESNGSYCGLNLVLTCGRDCNHAVEANPMAVRTDYRFFVGRPTEGQGSKVKADMR